MKFQFRKLALQLLFLCFVLFIPSIAAYAQTPTPPVVVSPDLSLAIAGILASLFTFGLKNLGSVFGIDLSGYSAALTAAVLAVVIALANSILALVPAPLQPVVAALMPVLAAILAAFGFHGIIKYIGGGSLKPAKTVKK
jgi:hypothetical protein